MIVHYNGTNWSSMTSNTTNNLKGVWGSSGTNVYAAGEEGVIVHYNGTNWSDMTSNTSNGLNAIWGDSASDIFSVGDSGTITHYNRLSITHPTGTRGRIAVMADGDMTTKSA